MNAMATTSRPKKTVDDFMALGGEVRAELITGELYVTPSPTSWHQHIVTNLCLILAPHIRNGRLGSTWVAPLDVHLPSGDIVEPDLIFVRRANRSIIQEWIRGVPDLLVEVVSPSNVERDRIVKRDLYARNQVPEYWIVDPDARTVEVLCLGEGDYLASGYFGPGSELVSSALPDLRLSIDDVFRSDRT